MFFKMESCPAVLFHGKTAVNNPKAKRYNFYFIPVKIFIETEGCDEADLILRLINGVAYVPLIIESYDTELIKYYSLSAAAKGCGVSKQTIYYAYRNLKTRIVRRKGGFKVFKIEWLDT